MGRMTRRLPATLLVLTAAVLLAAPAAAQSRREMQMMADIRMLQEQTQQMQQQLQAALDAISAQLKAISTRVDDQAGATRKSFADQKLAVGVCCLTCSAVGDRKSTVAVRNNFLCWIGREHSRRARQRDCPAAYARRQDRCTC